jgi:hypothetical protein
MRALGTASAACRPIAFAFALFVHQFSSSSSSSSSSSVAAMVDLLLHAAAMPPLLKSPCQDSLLSHPIAPAAAAAHNNRRLKRRQQQQQQQQQHCAVPLAFAAHQSVDKPWSSCRVSSDAFAHQSVDKPWSSSRLSSDGPRGALSDAGKRISALQSFRIKEQPLHLWSTSFLSFCLSVSPPLPTLSLSLSLPRSLPYFVPLFCHFACPAASSLSPSLFNETAFRALSSKQFLLFPSFGLCALLFLDLFAEDIWKSGAKFL